MAGFCITNETEIIETNYCNRDGIVKEKKHYYYPAPSGVYAYVLAYESYDKKLKTKIMKPYSYDESVRGKDVLVKAFTLEMYINGQDEYATLDMDKNSEEVKYGIKMGFISTVSYKIATDIYNTGVGAKIIYLDDLPNDIESLNKMYLIANRMQTALNVILNSKHYLYGTHEVSSEMFNSGSTVGKSEFDLLRKTYGVEWKEKYNSIKSPQKKMFFKNEFHSGIGYDAYMDIMESYFNEKNGVPVWKKAIEKKIKELTQKI